jgi:DNA helicase-2/ATP-dependent DNA helicase PcrA
VTLPAPIGPRSLTPEQHEAINIRATRVLLVASAGSGKTEVLTRRLVRILAESEGEAFHCLAVTYTVKAAEELRSRIMASAASEAWRADTDTLHGFALDWLRRYGEVVDIGPDVVVYAADEDRLALIQEYLASLGLQDEVGADVGESLRPLLALFDQHRTLQPGLPYPAGQEPLLGVPNSELYDGYLESLSRAGGIDFPGMLAKLLEALEVDDWLGKNFRSLYRHILVDEAQDLTPAQSAVLRAFAGDGDEVSLFAVADDRQSINSYAGGAFENARSLVGRTAADHPLTLSHNFRSSAEIMGAAERLASYFADTTVKARTAAGAPAGIVRTIACDNPEDEAERVVAWIESLLGEGLDSETLADGEDPVVKPEQIGVIGRTRWTLDPVLHCLKQRGIEFAVQFDASGFLVAPEARVALDALAVEAVPTDAPAKRRLIGELHEMGVTDVTDVLTTLQDTGISSLAPVRDMLESVRTQDDLDAAFAALEGEGVSTWIDDAHKLRTLWANYSAATRVQSRDLKGFLREVARAQRTRPSDPGVRVTTIHRAKGLEFRAVVVIGAREGTIPDYRADTIHKMDEERRNFYVAITRAARALLVTWPYMTTDRYGRTHYQEPSRFLAEAGLS